MNNYQKLADDLMASLELSLPPIAVAFADVVPPNIPLYDGIVPAGCVFWQEAAKRVFVTSTKDHELCAIGVHTHNMSSPSAFHQSELQEALQAMSGLDYVRPEEVAAIPVVPRAVKHVIYGPLSDFPAEPEVVLLFAHAQQGLIISEAAARVDQGAPPAMGRPACAIIPQVLNHGCAAVSLGCCGARAYIDAMTDSVALWALPGKKLDAYCEQIGVLAAANKTLTTFHQRRKEDIESGKRPTVRQSLERLSSK
jgi:uncharacterized protein (DUF169 family)